MVCISRIRNVLNCCFALSSRVMAKVTTDGVLMHGRDNLTENSVYIQNPPNHPKNSDKGVHYDYLWPESKPSTCKRAAGVQHESWDHACGVSMDWDHIQTPFILLVYWWEKGPDRMDSTERWWRLSWKTCVLGEKQIHFLRYWNRDIIMVHQLWQAWVTYVPLGRWTVTLSEEEPMKIPRRRVPGERGGGQPCL